MAGLDNGDLEYNVSEAGVTVISPQNFQPILGLERVEALLRLGIPVNYMVRQADAEDWVSHDVREIYDILNQHELGHLLNILVLDEKQRNTFTKHDVLLTSLAGN